MSEQKYWAEETYWSDALEKFRRIEQAGDKKQFSIDLKELLEVIYDDTGPAYKLMEAMVSVHERESEDGYRGAPRVLLALLVRLEELSKKVHN
jgi:hypothetical protein